MSLAVPQSLTAIPVAYPKDKFVSYAELLPFVSAATPQSEPFVLLAESFSTPVAIIYAASHAPNLAAMVICAGFVPNPIAHWSRLAQAVARPWLFKLRPPRPIVEYFLVGKNAPSVLIQELRCAAKGVRPEVLSSRMQEVLNCDARDELARTTIPLLYLRATNDRLYCPRRAATRLRVTMVMTLRQMRERLASR
jgi:pimeloyl-ACP methyl ester carboxylesterase